MFTVTESIAIRAPLDRVFALSTRIELVQKTLGMKLVPSDAVGALTTGHITHQSRVHWRGWKFCLPTEHHTLITAFVPPHTYRLPARNNDSSDPIVFRAASFTDEQEHGRFKVFQHEHAFRQEQGKDTVLLDRIAFDLPFGVFGRLAARFLLAPHIRRLARKRFALIKTLAEGEDWRNWLEASI